MELTVACIDKSFHSASGGGRIHALKDISFAVPEGRIVCVVGPSGCGKTTLLRIISGLDRPDAGRVMLDKTEIAAPRREIGYLFQEPGLFPWRTVLRNVEFGLEVSGVQKNQRRERALHFLELVELKGFEEFYPKELSGGMKQKAALAMSLVMEPKVLLMDEPFVALDSQTRNYLQEVLLRAWEKTRGTLLFVTHNVDEAVFLGDEIICLTSRPAEVGKILEVDIARPRETTSSELNRIRREILFFLSEERKKSLQSA